MFRHRPQLEIGDERFPVIRLALHFQDDHFLAEVISGPMNGSETTDDAFAARSSDSAFEFRIVFSVGAEQLNRAGAWRQKVTANGRSGMRPSALVRISRFGFRIYSCRFS
jgi:hypothetical protein